MFTIDGATVKDAGHYNFGWKLGYAEYPEGQVTCTAAFDVNYTPKFIGDEIDVQSLACNFPWNLKVPIYTDLFGQTCISKVELGDTSEFLSYDEATNTIKTDDPDLLENYKGNHQIKL